MTKLTDKQIAACQKLGMSEKEMLDMYDDDEDVNKGIEMPWDLSKEEHKKAMKYANADEHKKPTKKTEPTEKTKKAPIVYNWNTDGKERKGNATKEQIVSAVAQFIAESELGCENVEIANKQGKITFTVGENSFSFSLTQHRKK